MQTDVTFIEARAIKRKWTTDSLSHVCKLCECGRRGGSSSIDKPSQSVWIPDPPHVCFLQKNVYKIVWQPLNNIFVALSQHGQKLGNQSDCRPIHVLVTIHMTSKLAALVHTHECVTGIADQQSSMST